MATRTIQKIRMADTVTKTALTQKQSLEVVQTLLHGSLSSLAYLRVFFAEKVFDQQPYAVSDRMPSYREYADGRLPKLPKGGTRLQTTMQVLRRGRSRRVDTFLDWLEQGAFLALKEGKLRALQIYVHSNEHEREKVVETYTFSVKYHADGRGGKTLAGIELDSPGRAGLTVEATTVALQQLLRHIMEMCSGLPELPEDRWVSMALFFHDGQGTAFHAKGFVPNTTKDLLFGRTDGWEKQTLKLEDLESAFHTTSMTVSHLYNTTIGSLSTVAEPIRIPAQLQFSKDDVAGDIDWTADSEVVAEEDISTKAPSNIDRTPSTIVPPDTERTSATGCNLVDLFTPAPTSDAATKLRSTTLSQASAQSSVEQVAPLAPAAHTLDTQSSNVPRMKSALQRMMRSENIAQGDTQTQQLHHTRNPSNDASISPPRPATSPVPQPASIQLRLLPQVSQQLLGVRAQLQEAARKLAKSSKSRAKKGSVVLCQCGFHKEEGDMVQCSYCKTWQHLQCYGYAGSDDPRLAEVHACYQCLLGTNGDDALAKVQDLTLKRRAMGHALRRGVKASADIASALGVDHKTASAIHDYFLQEGFITSASRPLRGAYAQSIKSQFVPAQEGAAYESMLAALFNPLTHVESFYTNMSTHCVEVGKQLRALRSASMPPATTPASQLKMKATSATPASGLDLRRSATPIETPVLKRPSLLKRQHEDDIFSTPAKRQATLTPVYQRLRSVQTQYVLRADGLSSSPFLT